MNESTEKKQAEIDWAFADQECEDLIRMMTALPSYYAIYQDLKADLESAKAKRREAGDRLAAIATAELERRRAVAG